MSITFFDDEEYYGNLFWPSNKRNLTSSSYGEEEELEELDIILTPEGQITPDSLEPSYKEEYINSKTNINFDLNVNKEININIPRSSTITEVIPKPKVFLIKKEKKENKKFLGKKKLSNEKNGKNGKKEKKDKKDRKNDFDDISRKIRARLLHACRYILNESLNEKEEIEELNLDDDLEDPLFPKAKPRKKKNPFHQYFFHKIDQEVILKTNIQYNLDLLNSTLREIFSTHHISKQVQKYGLDYNKILIQKIEKSPKKKKTKEILDMKLLQILEHFRKSKYYEPLKGLELLYENLIKEMYDKGEKKDYIDNFITCLNNYEIIYSQKKSKSKNNKKEK